MENIKKIKIDSVWYCKYEMKKDVAVHMPIIYPNGKVEEAVGYL